MFDFVLPMSNRDVTTCQSLISEIKKQSPNEAIAWEQPLTSLIKGIELHYHHETLTSILQLLPPPITQALFLRLLASTSFNYSCLDTLVTYINSLSAEERANQVELIRCLFTSPIELNQPEARNLILVLNSQEQGLLLTQLRNLGDAGGQDKDRTNNPYQRKIKETYRSNYLQLLDLLAKPKSKIAMTQPANINQSPIIANLLMSQLLEKETNKDKQKLIFLKLFKEYKQYDWSEHRFTALIQSRLITLFTTLPVIDIKDLFRLYLEITQRVQFSILYQLKFIEDLYDETKNTNIIAACLESADDNDHRLIIAFLIHCKITDRSLIQLSLKKLTVEQLASYYEHILALGQVPFYSNPELITDYLSIFGQHLNKLQCPQILLKQLAIKIHLLPINKIQIAILTIYKQLSTAEHLSMWLETLLEINKTYVIAHCVQFIVEYPGKLPLIVPILGKLPKEELCTIYCLMVSKGLDNSFFSCFLELFKDAEKHPHLFYLLSTTPVINPDLLDGFLSQLDDKALMCLINNLLMNTGENSEFQSTINQVLLVFCQRLYAESNPKALINQWKNQVFTERLVHYLLESPQCVFHLTTNYTKLYSWVTWTNPAEAIKHRIDALLNSVELGPDKLQQIALNWLEYFHAHTDQLTLVFHTLQATESNRTATGKKNLLGIKLACWGLMKPGVIYQEEEFLQLVQSPKPELFTPALSHLTQMESMKNDPYHGALRLTHSFPYFKEMNTEVLLKLLIHSVHKDTLINWKKGRIWLGSLNIEEQLNFITKLIDRVCSANTNPVLIQQTHLFITHLPLFDTLLPELNPLHWSWFMEHAPYDHLQQKALHWLDVIIQKHGVEKLDLSSLIAVLPQNSALISSFFKQPYLASPNTCAQIIAQLSENSDCHTLCLHLLQFSSQQDKRWVVQCLQIIFNQLNAVAINNTVLSMLQSLLLNFASSLSAQNATDKKLIINYLNLLNTQIKKSEHSKNIAELDQFMLNIFKTFSAVDRLWRQSIYSEAVFTQFVLRWVRNIDFESITLSLNDHPLTNLFVNCQASSFDLQLIKEPLIQKLLQFILSHPPQALTDEGFHELFALLLFPNKVILARQLLTNPQRSELPSKFLDLLANVLSPVELYLIYEHQGKPESLAHRLFSHRDGLKDLSTLQRSTLLDNIHTSTDLLRILDNQTSLTSRFNVTNELFQAYGTDAKSLSQKLGNWQVTPAALAALANFTIDIKHQHILEEVFQEKYYYRDFLNDYLHHPTLDMPINENSYLYHLTRHNLQTQGIQKPCHAQFIEHIPPKEAFPVIKQHFNLNQNIQALSVFFSPFNAKTPHINGALHSARWQYQLILIYSGLLEIIRFYKDEGTSEAAKLIIEQTELYQTCLLPLLSSPIKEGMDKTLITHLFALLHQYIKKVSHVDSDHYQRLHTTLGLFTSQLSTMKKFSPPRVYDFFRTDSSIASLNHQGQSRLTEEEATLLSNTDAGHKEWLSRFALEPEKQFTKLLTVGLKELQLTQNDERLWIFQTALFSSLTSQLDESTLKQCLDAINPDELSALISAFYEKGQVCLKAQKILQNIKPQAPIVQFIRQLLNSEPLILKQLITAAESLNLIALKDILSLAIHIQELELSEEQITALCLSLAISEQQDGNWLQMEFKLMAERIKHVENRQNQLTYLAFSYTADCDYEGRIQQLGSEKVAYLPVKTLVKCLNTYEPVFTNSTLNPHSYLITLDKILNHPQAANEILSRIDDNLVKYIIKAAIKNPVLYSELLEKMINSNNKELCLQELQLELHQLIKQNKDQQPDTIQDLDAEQIESNTAEDLNTILSIQRLLYLDKPAAELIPFIRSASNQETLRERQRFGADATLYMVLSNLIHKSRTPLKKCTSWLVHHSQNNIGTYGSSIAAMNAVQEVNYPTAYFYWLCWSTFKSEAVDYDITPLTDGFLNWLSKLDEKKLQETPDLIRLLEYIASKQALIYVIKNASKLNSIQASWLCTHCLHIAPNDSTLLPFIINLSSWSWLENYMRKSSPQNFGLLKAALGNSSYIRTINEKKENQLSFLTAVENNQFTAQQLLELISLVQNEQVRSLLIIHLLSQQEYLSSLKGDSVLTRLSTSDTHTPSRLNALVQQLDISILTGELINKLPPETAVSILCSVSHFHQLKEDQVDSLLKRYPHPEIVTYWVNHYSSMPNAHYTLAHLMKFADTYIITELNTMDPVKKEAIITRIICNLELFHPYPKILIEENEEVRLLLATRLFQNGHQHQVYITYINRLVEKLLNKNHQFSLQAIQILMTLSEKKEFSELKNKTASLTNQYLRAHAQAGKIELFYNADRDRLNIDSMMQQLQFNPPPKKTEPVKGFFSSLLGTKPEEAKTQATKNTTDDHPLLEILTDSRKHVSSFDYFLIHFKGDRNNISKVINDYLSYLFREGCTGARRKSLHQIADLMNRPELDLVIREELFSSFLRYPELYDKHISFALFQFDAKKTIQYYGLKGGEKNYTQVINICVWALQKLDSKQHKDLVTMATTAKSEAELELSFNQATGFFARIFMWIKRCWLSGWTGFFVPKLPVYVAPASAQIITDEPEVPIEENRSNVQSSYKQEPNLQSLLKEVSTPLTIEYLNDVIEAIQIFSLKFKVRNELEIRQKVQGLFLQVREVSKENNIIAKWLAENEAHFNNNLFRVMELLLMKGPRTALESFFVPLKDAASDLKIIIEEFCCFIPEQKEEQISLPVPETQHFGANIEARLESTIDSAAEIAYSTFLRAKEGLGTFFKPFTNPTPLPDSGSAPEIKLAH